jgi:hypothetical protein
MLQMLKLYLFSMFAILTYTTGNVRRKSYYQAK